MGNSYIPNDLIMVNKNELINFNNHSLVQFYHRNLAYIIIGLILIIGLFIFTKKQKKLYRSYFYVLFFLFLQVVLGIFTLTSGLNTYLASSPQLCSVLLVFSTINLYYYIK